MRHLDAASLAEDEAGGPARRNTASIDHLGDHQDTHASQREIREVLACRARFTAELLALKSLSAVARNMRGTMSLDTCLRVPYTEIQPVIYSIQYRNNLIAVQLLQVIYLSCLMEVLYTVCRTVCVAYVCQIEV